MGFQMDGLVGLMDSGRKSSAYKYKNSYPGPCRKLTRTKVFYINRLGYGFGLGHACPPNSGERLNRCGSMYNDVKWTYTAAQERPLSI